MRRSLQLGIVIIDGYGDTPKQFLYIRGPDIELRDKAGKQDEKAIAYMINELYDQIQLGDTFKALRLD